MIWALSPAQRDMLHRLSSDLTAYVVDVDRKDALHALVGAGLARCWSSDDGKPHLTPILLGRITPLGHAAYLQLSGVVSLPTLTSDNSPWLG